MSDTSDVVVAIPSAGRATSVFAKWIKGAKIVVPFHQHAEYQEANEEVEVVALPKKLPPGIHTSRQWIIDQWPKVFMVDDDVVAVRTVHKLKNRAVSSDEFSDLVNGMFQMLEDMGAYLCAFSWRSNPKWFQPSDPFMVKGDIASTMGVRKGGGLFFHPSLPLGEDTFISCYNAFKNRMVLCDNRYVATRATRMGGLPGGCSAFRTEELQKKCLDQLVEFFGDTIVPMSGELGKFSWISRINL